MNKSSYFLSVCMLLFVSANLFAQKSNTTSEEIKVWGNCGMCKKTIETAAKSAGAQEANWNEDTKVLAVVYNPRNSDNQKIQKAVAAVGYDTQDFTAPDAVYEKLHGCCQYDRKPASVTQHAAMMGGAKKEDGKCCSMENCGKSADCCKGMKCCEGKSCKSGGECCKPGNTCCKDGKCAKSSDGQAQACCKDAGCGKAKK